MKNFKVLGAHQPNFLPYLGFFDKMKMSDVFVIRDEVLFTASDYHHRNRIRINGNDNQNNPQCKWVKVPVEKVKDNIMHVPIRKDARVKDKLWREAILHDLKASYGGSPDFPEIFSEVRDIIEKGHSKLLSINMDLIYFFMKKFEINTKIVLASELGLKPEHFQKGDASQDLVDICKHLGAETYLSGSGGKSYLDLKKFEDVGINVEFQDFVHPTYQQMFPGFLPNMAAIDYLFCRNLDKPKFDFVKNGIRN